MHFFCILIRIWCSDSQKCALTTVWAVLIFHLTDILGEFNDYYNPTIKLTFFICSNLKECQNFEKFLWLKKKNGFMQSEYKWSILKY